MSPEDRPAICQENVGPGIFVDATLTCNIYLNTAADHVHGNSIP